MKHDLELDGVMLNLEVQFPHLLKKKKSSIVKT
jgi:hypothetical protein